MSVIDRCETLSQFLSKDINNVVATTLRSLPGTASTAGKGPDLVSLGAAVAAGVHQQLGAVLVLRAINIDTVARGQVLDVACGGDGPLLGRLAGVARVEHEPLRLGITGRGVQAGGIPLAAGVERQ